MSDILKNQVMNHEYFNLKIILATIITIEINILQNYMNK